MPPKQRRTLIAALPDFSAKSPLRPMQFVRASNLLHLFRIFQQKNCRTAPKFCRVQQSVFLVMEKADMSKRHNHIIFVAYVNNIVITY